MFTAALLVMLPIIEWDWPPRYTCIQRQKLQQNGGVYGFPFYAWYSDKGFHKSSFGGFYKRDAQRWDQMRWYPPVLDDK